MTLNIELSAPILIVEDDAIGSLKFHLGKAHLTTPKPCPLSSFQLDMDLTDTQLRYREWDVTNQTGGLVDENRGREECDILDPRDRIAIAPIALKISSKLSKLKQISVQVMKRRIQKADKAQRYSNT